MMKTKILKNIKEGAALIKKGELVAFSTETVYGLGANALDEKALEKIFIAKNRPQDNPLILHFSNVKDMEKYIKVTNDTQLKLMKLLPAPLTLIFDKTELVNSVASAGLDTVAVRIPESKLARKLIKEVNSPVAAPSANISTRPSGTTYKDVLADFDGKIAAVMKGKPASIGVESTVVDARSGVVKVLRLGGYSVEKLAEEFNVEIATDPKEKIASPGTRYKHYSPKCKFTTFKQGEDMVKNILDYSSTCEHSHIIFCKSENAKKYAGKNIHKLGSSDKEVAANIFSAMRLAENTFDEILCEEFNDIGLYKAVNNRIKKASGEN